MIIALVIWLLAWLYGYWLLVRLYGYWFGYWFGYMVTGLVIGLVIWLLFWLSPTLGAIYTKETQPIARESYTSSTLG